jgi:RNA polymerase sigma-70 factor (ECF subfamily)
LNTHTEPFAEEFSDEELALQAQQGELTSFEQLLHRFEDRIFRFVVSKVSNAHDAQDLTQQAFLKAYRNIHRYDSQYRFSTWIYTITRRLVISHYRASRSFDELDEQQVGQIRTTPADQLARTDEYSNIWDFARTALPETHMTALWLMYHEDMSVKEISRTMGKSQTYVKVLLHRSRNKLAELISPDGQQVQREQGWESLHVISSNLSSNLHTNQPSRGSS